ncbi:MAG: isoleucine--tRNA ligase [Candidatus Pacebacteria bacterium]|nr:isoleucine--tRNA ligase [Candidatus Paceibacterota bacterium]PIR61308.1 MAG: isoleucine--tRNA ligase [Candidatus Pacebacteria bacterium CG10_big_fil_rev_8_21_14_0_10_45_6]
MSKTVQSFPTTLDLPQLERSQLEYWRQNNTFEKSVSNRPKDKQYVFYDGPPFATGMPHYGHLLGSTSKDVFPRYWTMKGYRVERVWGWDCHGLPIENMIEKKLGLTHGKNEIEAYGIDRFNAACRSEVLRLDGEWKTIIERLGRWADFDNNYKTMDRTYMESVWWGFKQLSEKGHIYQGKKVILYCSRCTTPLSNFEIAMDNSYSTVTDTATTYKYKISGTKNQYLLAWSTTPWNKLATPALAVHPTLEYVTVRQGDAEYILAKSRLEMLEDKPYEIVTQQLGADLTKLEFEPHFDFYPNRENGEKFGVIVADEFVTDSEGTGIVTLAAYGEDDYRIMQEHCIQVIEHVDEHGKLKAELGSWVGKSINEANSVVDDALLERGLVYKQEAHTHSVAECYRCGTRLYHAPLPAWFVNVQKLKPALKDANEQMNWYPEHLKQGRFGNGLSTAPDWNISRSRYWGTPLPIWRSEDGKERIVGSIAELQEWACQPNEVVNLTDIHRESIDAIKVWIDDEKTIVGTRVPEVFDCWVESGSMPFASRHYPFENEKEFESSYPAQFVSEYIAQTRAWFYTMHVLSVGIFGKPAVENTLTTGTILAEDGSKMSKSKNNFPDPMQVIDTFGADSLRLYLMSSPVMKSENLSFNEKEVSDIRKKVFLIWYNCISLYKLNNPKNEPLKQVTTKPKNVLDRWILSRVQTYIASTTRDMDAYNVVDSARGLMQLLNEISTWYVRRSRDRLADSENTESLAVYGTVLWQLALLFAPITPFFAEFVHQQISDENSSIHLLDWPTPNTKLLDTNLEQEMAVIRKVVEQAHAARAAAGIKIRQPLGTIVVWDTTKKPSEETLAVLKAETNIKNVTWTQTTEQQRVELDTNLTPELATEGAARDLMRSIQVLRKKQGLSRGEHATVTVKEIPTGWQDEIERKTGTNLTIGPELSLVL